MGVDNVGMDEVGLDEMGVDELAVGRSGYRTKWEWTNWEWRKWERTGSSLSVPLMASKIVLSNTMCTCMIEPGQSGPWALRSPRTLYDCGVLEEAVGSSI